MLFIQQAFGRVGGDHQSPLQSKNSPFLFWEGPSGLGAVELAVATLEVMSLLEHS